eukprot:TCONS_00071399-protein
MGKLIFALLLCMNLMEVWSIRGRITSNERYCVPQPYKPGGGIRKVQDIKAPQATLKTTGFLGVIAKGAKKTGDAAKVATKVTTEFAKFGKLFKTASKMAPWLGVLSGVLGFLGQTPSVGDAIKAVNKAFKEFADEITKRMNEMKGYVDDSILKKESEWVEKELKVLFNGWADCIVYYHDESDVNECQRKAFMDIRKNRAHFMLFSGKNPTRKELKRLEFQFVSIRDYSFLTLLVLRSLIDSFKAEKGKEKDYERLLKQGMVIPEELADYANFVNNEILDFYDTGTKSICRGTFTCGKMDTKYRTVFGFGRIKPLRYPVHRQMECKCKMIPDAANHEWCKYKIELDINNAPPGEGEYWKDHSNLERRGEKDLFALSDIYWKETSSVVRKYWYETVMVQVPKWEEFAVQAQKEYEEFRGGNLALKRPTIQSSGDPERLPASVDGYTKYCHSPYVVSTTEAGRNQWWKVILDGVYEINTVIFYNQVDTDHSGQLSNVDIYVYDFGGKRSLCANTGDMKNVYIRQFECNAGAIGNVVMLSKMDEGSIRLCEVVAYGEKVKRNGQNLALNRPTLQSTTTGQHSSSHAVDGQKSKCSLSENTCSKTEIAISGKRSWWEVALDQPYHVDRVIIHGCGNSLSDIIIFAIDEETIETEEDWRERPRRDIYEGRKGQKVSMCKYLANVDETASVHNIKCDQPAYGNILRIAKRNRNDEYLQLCEVEVYGHLFKSEEDSDNVAYHGITKQSGDQSSQSGSHLAVNGNHVNCRLTEHTLSITESSSDSWWEVQLHSLSLIKSVIIYNREDCCGDQLSDATIYVNFISNDAMRASNPPFNQTGNMEGVKAKEFTNERRFFGEVVKIEKKKHDAPLSLCEVEVYGKTVTEQEKNKMERAEDCERYKQKVAKMKAEGRSRKSMRGVLSRMTFFCSGA